MPPKARITVDMVVAAAMEVIREGGYESLSIRTVARRLHCSTQPVMSHFATTEELKKAAYARADRMHTESLMRPLPGTDPVLGIGLNYIRFAAEEPQLFRFLFQSGLMRTSGLLEMAGAEELQPVLAPMQAGLGLDTQKTRDVFLQVALFAHGYASLVVSHALEFHEEETARMLTRAWTGAAFAAAKEDKP